MIKNLTYFYYGIVTLLFLAFLAIVIDMVKKEHYSRGMVAGQKVSRETAIEAGVGEFVITNKLTGQSEFRWKTNAVYLFKQK
jgi:hypothetical protein